MPKKQQPLVERIASEIIVEQNGFSQVNFSSHFAFSEVCEKAFERAYRKTRRMNPTTLGIIAATGKADKLGVTGTALYRVHCATYLDKKESGKTLLRTIAATAIAAKVADLLEDWFRRAQDGKAFEDLGFTLVQI